MVGSLKKLILGELPMSCDVVEIRLNSGLVISLYDNSQLGWVKKSKPTERQMWERMAHLISNTDFEAVRKLYGKVAPEPEEICTSLVNK